MPLPTPARINPMHGTASQPAVHGAPTGVR